MKRFLALLISMLMLISAQTVLAIELGADEAIVTLEALTKSNCPELGTSSQSVNSPQLMAENEDYLIVAMGMNGKNYQVCSVVQIWDKKTGELVKNITHATSNATWYCPVRDLYVDGNMLYISWGNALYTVGTTALYATGTSDSSFAPLKAYDLSKLKTEDGIGTGLYLYGGNARTNTNEPYNLGTISYLDKEGGKLYSSKVSSKASNKRTYAVMDVDSVEAGVKAGTADEVVKNTFYTTGVSMNAVKFIVKDGWLFEVLQNKAGIVGYATDTLLDGEEEVMNNTIYAYDLSGVTLTTEAQDVTSCLKGIFTTQTAGTKAIKDIEVVGDYMYVATQSTMTTDVEEESVTTVIGGVEVVSLLPAKAEGLTSAATLTASKTLTGAGGAMDLEVIRGNLFAGFTGPQLLAANSDTKSDPGEIVIYDIGENPADPKVWAREDITFGVYDFSVNEADEKIYVLNDTMGKPSRLSIPISKSMPKFKSGEFAFGSKLTENIPYLTSFGGDDILPDTAWSANRGQLIAENDKYIFAVTAKNNLTTCAVVQIYDKSNGKLLTTLSEKTDVSNHYRMVRSLSVSGDVLYITWGFSWNDGQTNASTVGSTTSETRAYDVSNVEEGDVLTGLKLHSGGARTNTHAPFMLGNLSYFDEGSGKLYVSCVINGTYNSKSYNSYNHADVKAALKSGAESVDASETFTTGKLSKNAVKFIVKDGWLYELLQSKAGFSEYDGADVAETLVDGEGNPINNMVRVYNLNASSNSDREPCLRGTYITATEGAKAIKDIEVVGDYLYAAVQTLETTGEGEEAVTTVSGGVEVVPLAAAKAAGVTADNAAVLGKTKTLTGNGGVLTLDSVNDVLIAGFTGPEHFAMPNKSDKGEIVAYDTYANGADPTVIERCEISYGAADLAINEQSGVIYVLNDTMGPPTMTAYSFQFPGVEFYEGDEGSFVITAGACDIKAEIKNPDLVDGTLICALYAGNRLSDVVITTNSADGLITIAEDYNMGADITKVKILCVTDEETIVPICDAAVTIK